MSVDTSLPQGGPADVRSYPTWRLRQMATWGTPGRRVALALGMVAGAVTILGTFLPWLQRTDGRTFSGWDLYDLRSAAGENLFVIRGMFRAGDFFFTGLVTLLLGALIVLGAGALLIAHTKPPPKRLLVRVALVLPAALGAVAALLVTTVNLVSALSAPDAAGVSVRYGLWVIGAGAMAFLFLAFALGGKTRRAQQRWEHKAPTRPGWYPDLTGPNDQRYWNGSTWTDQESRREQQPADQETGSGTGPAASTTPGPEAQTVEQGVTKQEPVPSSTGR